MRNYIQLRSFALALALTALCAGCSRSPSAPASASAESPVRVNVTVRQQGAEITIVVHVDNASAESLYVCRRVGNNDPEFDYAKGPGPYVYYGGDGTVVLFWGMTIGAAPGIELMPQFRYGAYVRLLEPGRRMSLDSVLRPTTSEFTPWRQSIWFDPDKPDGGRGNHSEFKVTSLVAIVAYWEKVPVETSVLSTHEFEDFSAQEAAARVAKYAVDGELFISASFTKLTMLSHRSFCAVVSNAILRSGNVDPVVGVEDVQFLAYSRRIALPMPIILGNEIENVEPLKWPGRR